MDEQAWRAARREFIRTHHPDHGGDPAEFVAGLRALDAAAAAVPPAAPQHPPRVFVVPDQPWPVSAVSRLIRLIRRRQDPPRVK